MCRSAHLSSAFSLCWKRFRSCYHVVSSKCSNVFFVCFRCVFNASVFVTCSVEVFAISTWAGLIQLLLNSVNPIYKTALIRVCRSSVCCFSPLLVTVISLFFKFTCLVDSGQIARSWPAIFPAGEVVCSKTIGPNNGVQWSESANMH